MSSWVLLLLASIDCFAQSTLVGYLGLTPAQSASIQQLNNAYYSNDYSTEQSRISVVTGELFTIYASPAPDPNQLGPRYVELEAIRRDIAAHVATLQQQIAALLTPTQMAAIQNLNNSVTLQPLLRDAQCAFLVNTPVGFDPAFSGVLSDTLSGDFSIIGSISYLPYIPPAPSASFCGSNVFPIDVREYLNLTDAEVSAIFAGSASYNDYYSRQQNSIADLQVQIRDETAKPSPDPMTLGTEYARLAAIGQDLQNQASQFQQMARAALTAQQVTQLTALQNMANLQPLLYTAESCNLLVLSLPNQASSVTYANSCVLH